MANVEMLHSSKSNEGALLKIQHICEGLSDLLERVEKHRDRLRGVDHSNLEAMPREKTRIGERARLSEQTNRRERAIPREKPIKLER